LVEVSRYAAYRTLSGYSGGDQPQYVVVLTSASVWRQTLRLTGRTPAKKPSSPNISGGRSASNSIHRSLVSYEYDAQSGHGSGHDAGLELDYKDLNLACQAHIPDTEPNYEDHPALAQMEVLPWLFSGL